MMDLTRYKTLIFDCDGVLLNSNGVKTRAFFDTALPYGEPAAQALVDYHVRTGGVSRYQKFDYFLRSILRKDAVTEAELRQLLDSYARKVRQGLLTCEITAGLAQLRSETRKCRWLVVSGGDQAELREVFAQKELDHYFDGGIFGSPDSKDVILARELGTGNIKRPALFFGDSQYDYEAATRAGTDFVFVRSWSEIEGIQTPSESPGVTMIDTMSDLTKQAQNRPRKHADKKLRKHGILCVLNIEEHGAADGHRRFTLSGWVIDKQGGSPSVVVSDGIKYFHKPNETRKRIAARVSKQIQAPVNDKCGFSIEIETDRDFDVCIELGGELLHWEHVQVAEPEISPLRKGTSLAAGDPVVAKLNEEDARLRQFGNSFWSPESGFPIQGARDEDADQGAAVATEALFYYFSNQSDRITPTHLKAVAEAWGTLAVCIAPPQKLSASEAMRSGLFGGTSGPLAALIGACTKEHFCIDLVRHAAGGRLSVPSPFSTGQAYCSESLDTGNGVNCLRFVDGDNSFFLLQYVSSADGLYFPAENLLINLSHINEAHVRRLQEKLLLDFAKVVSYSRSTNSFFGIIASHNRPYHFYYDIWPSLVELAGNQDLVEKIGTVVMRKDHDFVAPTLVTAFRKCVVLDQNEIDSITIDENKFFVHLGACHNLRDRFSYVKADRVLIDEITKAPSHHAQEKAALLAGCHPVVWIGVEGQKRCWLEQVEGYAFILNQLAQRYPRLGVVFDGWTMPCTPSSQSLEEANKDRDVANRIVSSLNASIAHVSVIGATTATKLVVGSKVDFFIGNFATGSMHISRMLGKPGFCHLSGKFSEISLRSAMHVHPDSRVYLLPKTYVSDKQDDEQDVRHDLLSYSIDGQRFYRFIEERLASVLGEPPAPVARFFIEPPYSVHGDLRLYMKMASHGNLIRMFPGGKPPSTVEDLSRYSEGYLGGNLLYGSFPFGGHQMVSGRSEYLVWLIDPLRRCLTHAGQLAKTAASKKQAAGLCDVLRAGHKSLDNSLTRLISGINVPFGKCTEQMLATAIDNLANRFVFVGIDERQSDSFDLLCATMRWERSVFPDALPSPSWQPKGEVSDEALGLAKDLNVYDRQLYDAALKIFDEGLVPQPQALERADALPRRRRALPHR